MDLQQFVRHHPPALETDEVRYGRGASMNASSETTCDIVTRFHRAFENHCPEDLDDLIGEACAFSRIRLRRRTVLATRGVRPHSGTCIVQRAPANFK